MTDTLNVHIYNLVKRFFWAKLLVSQNVKYYFITWNLHTDSHRWLNAKELHVLSVEASELSEVIDQETNFKNIFEQIFLLEVVHNDQKLLFLIHGFVIIVSKYLRNGISLSGHIRSRIFLVFLFVNSFDARIVSLH